MQVAFRVDASLQIGTGHVMRCLALADALRLHGAKSTFICREHEGNLIKQIKQRGHAVINLPIDSRKNEINEQDKLAHAAWLGGPWTHDAEQTREAIRGNTFDWLVVDHYALDIRWEQALFLHYKKLMVIDDLADREHCCDLLLDQNLGRFAKDYEGLVLQNVITLIGPRYALLRPEFAQWRAYSLRRREYGQLQNILITMGGVDIDNVTGQVLTALAKSDLPQTIRITVVMGPHAPWLNRVKEQAARMMRATTVLVGVSNMAQLMADSDLCIGAAGSTSWERCCLGLPSVMLVLAPNQLAGALALKNLGATEVIEKHEQISKYMFTNEMLTKLSHASISVTDGCGGERVASLMKENINASELSYSRFE